jgi:hypothetical protein
MPAPSTGRDLHVDVPLSNVVIGRRPEGFIADMLMPTTMVSKQSDIYYKFRHLEWFRDQDRDLTLRAPGTEAKKRHITVTSDTYFAPNYALSTDWPVEDQVNADEVLQWAESQSEALTDWLMLDWERRVETICVATSNVGTVSTVASQWSDHTNSSPLSDLNTKVEQFRQRTGLKPNTMILPQQVLTELRLNDQLRDVLFGQVQGGLASAQQIGALVDIPNVLVPMSLVNTAAEADPQDGTLANIWGNHCWLARVNNIQGRFTDTWLNAFRWTNPLLGVPMAVIRHPFDTKKRIFEIEVSYYQTEKVVSSDLAERIVDVI